MIKAYNLSITFNEEHQALDDLNVHIHRGEFAFLVGPSGAGKSTFLKMITKEMSVFRFCC